MTYSELKSRHKGSSFTGRHRKSFTLLCEHLGCEEGGTLATEYQPNPTVTDLHAILKKYTHTRTPGLIASPMRPDFGVTPGIGGNVA